MMQGTEVSAGEKWRQRSVLVIRPSVGYAVSNCPHHWQRFQVLKPADCTPRENVSDWKKIPNSFCVSPMLSIVEATSGEDGLTNFHNRNQRAESKPRGAVRARHQLRFRFNVWIGFYSETNKMHRCIKFILFWNDTLHVSGGLYSLKNVCWCMYSLELLMMDGKTVRNM